MEQIFARLPIKEAVRASCVCKHWQSIVFSRSFVTFILKFKIPRRWSIAQGIRSIRDGASVIRGFSSCTLAVACTQQRMISCNYEDVVGHVECNERRVACSNPKSASQLGSILAPFFLGEFCSIPFALSPKKEIFSDWIDSRCVSLDKDSAWIQSIFTNSSSAFSWSSTQSPQHSRMLAAISSRRVCGNRVTATWKLFRQILYCIATQSRQGLSSTLPVSRPAQAIKDYNCVASQIKVHMGSRPEL